MKKNLPFSLIVLFTVFAGIPGDVAYQNHSFHCKTYRCNNNVQKRSVIFFENQMADKSKNEESRDRIISLTQAGDQYKKGYDIIADQAVRAGIIFEMSDFEFTKFWGRNLVKYHTISVSQKTEG